MSRTAWQSKIARKGALPSTVEGHRPKDERRSSRQVIVLRHSCSYRSERATSKTSSGAAVAGVTRMGRDPVLGARSRDHTWRAIARDPTEGIRARGGDRLDHPRNAAET